MRTLSRCASLPLMRADIRGHQQLTRMLQVELAPIQEMLPDEMVMHILARVSPYSLGAVACTCSHWKMLAEVRDNLHAHRTARVSWRKAIFCAQRPKLWETACDEAFQQQIPEKHERAALVRHSFRGCWRRLFLERPHLRFDGIYVSRNSYIRTGVPEMSRHKAVHVVLYYRYYR